MINFLNKFSSFFRSSCLADLVFAGELRRVQMRLVLMLSETAGGEAGAAGRHGRR